MGDVGRMVEALSLCLNCTGGFWEMTFFSVALCLAQG